MNTQNNYRLCLSNRQNLAHKISLWCERKTDAFKLRTLCYSLKNDSFPENEEIDIWRLVWSSLEDRRKSDRRDEFKEQVNHAIDSLENPGNYQQSFEFRRLMLTLNR